LAVGQVLGPQGTSGKVRVYPLTDFPERLERLTEIVLRSAAGDRPARVEGVWPHGRVYLFKFAGVDDPGTAARLKGMYLTVAVADAVQLPPGEYYVHEIVGLRVADTGGAELGVVEQVLHTGANDVWVVSRPDGGQLLVPALKAVVLNVDREAGVLTVRPLEEWLG
jgi:16S rRNA processing protein RimM